MSLRDSSLKFNIPDTGIIVNGKDFANFGLAGLQKNQRQTKSMDTNKRKKRKSDKPPTREEELLLENEALRCENELLKKVTSLNSSRRESQKAQAIMELRHKFDLNLL
jgi:transposase